MNDGRYEFYGERTEARLRSYSRTMEDVVADHEALDADTVAEDYLFSSNGLKLAANSLADVPVIPPRVLAAQEEAINRLDEHDGCEEVIDELRHNRDEVLISILYARRYCFNDIWVGEFGDLYVSVEGLIRHLRPALFRGASDPRLELFRDQCPECLQDNFDHEGGCQYEDGLRLLEKRRHHAVASHLHCGAMGQALLNHMNRCLGRLEAIAQRVGETRHTVTDGVEVVDPHRILPVIHLGDLNHNLEKPSPEAMAVTVLPPLTDEPYCDPEENYHHTPHRACRYLVS